VSGIISLIESLFKNFLWGRSGEARKINWIKWSSICKPKGSGGQGIRDLRIFNMALLGKWWWRMKVDIRALWKMVLIRRYGSNLE
jgi:hypothetical protein